MASETPGAWKLKGDKGFCRLGPGLLPPGLPGQDGGGAAAHLELGVEQVRAVRHAQAVRAVRRQGLGRRRPRVAARARREKALGLSRTPLRTHQA